MGLIQQGRSGPVEHEDEFGPREDWSQIWTPGVLDRKKVISPADTVWETTPLGRVRVMASPERTDGRIFSIDAFELEIPAGSRSGKHWKMADEVYYVLVGDGYALQWEVEAEIAEKYYARIAMEPKRYDIKQGDTLYVPQNHVCQIFAADGTPLRLLQRAEPGVQAPRLRHRALLRAGIGLQSGRRRTGRHLGLIHRLRSGGLPRPPDRSPLR